MKRSVVSVSRIVDQEERGAVRGRVSSLLTVLVLRVAMYYDVVFAPIDKTQACISNAIRYCEDQLMIHAYLMSAVTAFGCVALLLRRCETNMVSKQETRKKVRIKEMARSG